MLKLLVKYFKNRLPVLLVAKNKLEISAAIILKKDPKKIRLQNNLVFISPEANNFFQLILEIFIKQVYNPKFLPINTNDIVVDIGANIGVFSLYAATKTQNNIFAYEPLLENFNYLTKNIKSNRLDNIRANHLAVSNKVGIKKLYLTKAKTDNLLFPKLDQKNLQTASIKSTTLVKIFQDNQLQKINFLKLDCEGAEGLILKSTPTSYLQRIDKIAMEFHDNLSPLSHTQITSILRIANFKVTRLWDHKTPSGYIYAKNLRQI